MGLKSVSRSIALLVAGIVIASATIAQTSTESEVPYSRKGADTCIACHDDQESLAIFRTKHAVPSDSRSPFGHGQLQCEACHGPGGDHGRRVRRGQERPPVIDFGSHEPTEISVQNSMCLDCHNADVGFGWFIERTILR